MEDQISKLFKALSDKSRMQIFHSLAIVSTALSISQISNDFNMSRQGVTKHIKILEEASLIKINIKGRERFYSANIEQLNNIKNWLSYYDKFWDNSLTSLTKYLD